MLARLKEYKELIAILVFFLGGFFFLEKRYVFNDEFSAMQSDLSSFRGEAATKGDVAVLKCLLTEYMKLTQMQLKATDLEEEIDDMIEDSLSFPPEGELVSPVMATNFERHQNALVLKVQQLHELEADMGQILDALQRQECGGAI